MEGWDGSDVGLSQMDEGVGDEVEDGEENGRGVRGTRQGKDDGIQ